MNKVLRLLATSAACTTLMLGAALGASEEQPAANRKLLPGYLKNEQSTPGYIHNTAVIFIYGDYERHSWYEGTPDVGGTAVRFELTILPNGNLDLSTIEDKWKFEDGYRARFTHIDANGKAGVPFELQDAYPGDSWRMLIPDGPRQNQREMYTLLPGHQ